MAAAIIKLDSLANPIWTATQDDHLLTAANVGFAFRFVAGIKVRGEAFKFRRASVYAAEIRGDSQLLSTGANFQRVLVPKPCHCCIRNAPPLGFAHSFGINGIQA